MLCLAKHLIIKNQKTAMILNFSSNRGNEIIPVKRQAPRQMMQKQTG